MDLIDVLAQKVVVARIMSGDQMRAVFSQHRSASPLVMTIGGHHG